MAFIFHPYPCRPIKNEILIFPGSIYMIDYANIIWQAMFQMGIPVKKYVFNNA